MHNPKLITALVVGLGLGLAGAAYASDDCHVPMANWQPREAAAKMAESQGWTVRRIKVDDGCYEIKGREIEAKLDPQTLQVVEFEYEDEDDDDKKGKKKNKNKSNSSSTMAPQTPPNNGLFTPGTKPIVE